MAIELTTGSDAINWTSLVSHGANGSATLACGWYKWGASIQGRLFSASSGIWGGEADGVGGLTFRTNNTTDGQWDTGNIGVGNGEWWFIAALGAGGPSSVAAWRCWVGNASTPPVEKTLTTTVSPSGTNTGSTAFYLMSDQSLGLGLVGHCAHFGYFATTAAAGVTTHPFQIATAGAITQAAADYVLRAYVLPYWRGDGWRAAGSIRRNGVLNASTDELVYLSLDANSAAQRIQNINATATTPIVPTYTGSIALSNEASPGSPFFRNATMPYKPRR